MTDAPVTDCHSEGCGECEVCKRLDFLEWASSVSGGIPSSIESNSRVDDYIKEHYPDD